MCNGKCSGKGKCCRAFDKAITPAPVTPPPAAPAPANDQKAAPDAPKKKCCGGACHPKK